MAIQQLLHHSSGLGGQTNSRSERETPSRPPLGTINVIFAAPGRTGSCPSRVMSVARLSSEDTNHEPKRARLERPLVMGFSDEDKIETIQPHDDALVITLRIGGYDVKREELVEFLEQNIDVFTWNAYEAPGVDPKFICHHLNVNPLIAPKKQPPRRPSKEHIEAVREEVTRLK